MPTMIRILGFAGLIPFVGLAILVTLVSDNTRITTALELYAFAIFCFLCGVWWPAVDMHKAKIARIVLSNVFLLVAFFSYIFFAEYWLLIGAALFMILWAIERFSALMPKSPQDYQNMRLILSLVASASLLITYIGRVM